MAAMTARSRSFRVEDSVATRHDEDAPLTVDVASETPARRSPQRVVGGTVGSLDAAGRRTVEVVVDGWRFEFVVEDAGRAALRERASRDRSVGLGGGGPLEIRAIIPGRIASVAVTAGDRVEAGQTMLAVEAMKMQNELRAPRAGTVRRVAAVEGATVELGDLLVVLG